MTTVNAGARYIPTDSHVRSVGEAVTVREHAKEGIVWTGTLTGYLFLIKPLTGATRVIAYRKTTNGGLSWGAPVTVRTPDANFLAYHSSTTGNEFRVWADWWTPSLTGDKIHLGWFERYTSGGSDSQGIYYSSLDVSTDTLTAPALILNDTLLSARPVTDIVKSRGGRLYISAEMRRFLSSDDDGATWTTRAAFGGEVPFDGVLMPGNDTFIVNRMLFMYLAHVDSVWRLRIASYEPSDNTWSAGTAELTTLDDNHNRPPVATPLHWALGTLVFIRNGPTNSSSLLGFRVLSEFDIGPLTSIVTGLDTTPATFTTWGPHGILQDAVNQRIYVPVLHETTFTQPDGSSVRPAMVAVSGDEGTTWSFERMSDGVNPNGTLRFPLYVGRLKGVITQDRPGRVAPFWLQSATAQDLVYLNFPRSIEVSS